jgi:DNA (cytosine-5)-methyltransferase 1
MQVHPTKDSESLSLPTLATPTTGETVGPSLATSGGENLRTQIAILNGKYVSLPTPTTQDSSGQCRDHGGDLLHEVICGCPRSERKETLLRTPAASEGERGHQPASKAKARGGQQTLSGQFMDLFPTPNLPTPTVSDQYTGNLASTQQKPGSMHSVTLAQVFHKTDLFPTPMASEGTKAPSQQTSEVKGKTGQVWLSNVAKDLEQTNDKIQTDWGKFDPAIRRWETILGRPAPEPTKPDGKDNNHRLSSKFTEWMMGLPDGWITGHDLKRNDELKLAGNGVVPQQAELALRLLLELPEGER